MQRLDKAESLISLLSQKQVGSRQDDNQNIYSGFSCIFNTESAWFFYTSSSYRDYVKKCSVVFIDGIGIKMALRARGFSVPRYHGPDLLSDLLSSSHYDHILLIGGHPDAVRELRMNQHKTKISGILELPMFSNAAEIYNLDQTLDSFLNDFVGSKLLLISLGLPKQELFSSMLYDKGLIDVNRDFTVPIGAALDFWVGRRKRAGILWQRLGLEWLPRLINEPRMFLRNIRSAMAMLWTLIS